MVGIYKITNPNGRIYIGQSTNIKVRWDKYEKLACKDQPSLYSSLNKYGWENHQKEIIEKCEADLLDEREIFWGNHYNVLSNKHLNNRLGRGIGSYDSEETKHKKRECHKGRSNYWLKGKKLTESHKEKISKSKKGHKCYNEEWKEKHLEGVRNRNFKQSQYHKNSIKKSKCKPILQLDLKGNLIKEWESGKQAAQVLEYTQPNINACCNGKIPTYKGYIWKFKI